MANPHKGEVAFEANGETYKLVFDFNAICELEDALGVSASAIGEAIGDKLSNLRTVFRIGLSRHHNLSDPETGDILTDIGGEKAGELIGQAFSLSFPSADEPKGPVGNGQKIVKR